MKKIFFILCLLIPFLSIGQTDVDKNYSKPYFQGNIRVADTLGVDSLIRFSDGTTQYTAATPDGNGILDAANDGDSIPSTYNVGIIDSVDFGDNLLHLDATNGLVGIGGSPTSKPLEIFGNFTDGDILEIIGDPTGQSDRVATINYSGRDGFLHLYANDIASTKISGNGDSWVGRGGFRIGFNSYLIPQSATLVIKGDGVTSGTKAASILNSSSIEKFFVRDDGLVSVSDVLGVGTSSPDASAILDVESTTQGMLAPRMTSTERDAISSPANGLIIYNTTLELFNYYNGISWRNLADAPLNEIIINSEADFDTTVAGHISIKDGFTYKQGVNPLTITRSIDLSDISSISSFRSNYGTISYTGDSTMFIGSISGVFAVDKSAIIGAGTTKIWELKGSGNPAGNILVPFQVTFANFSGVGILDSIGGINYSSVQHSSCGEGLVLKDVSIIDMNNNPWNNQSTSNSPRIVLAGTSASPKINSFPLTIQSGESFLQISKDYTVTGSAVISGNQFSDALGGEFLASAITGSITAFADNGDGGTTVTSAAHGLTIEQVDSIFGTTSYNGNHDIFNITTNTFDIPVTFVADDATGTFTTGDSEDFKQSNMFSFNGNGDYPNTVMIGSAWINGNATATTGFVDGTWQDLNLGSGVTLSGLSSFFAISDAATGELEYTGPGTFDGEFVYILTGSKSGSTETYNMGHAINGSDPTGPEMPLEIKNEEIPAVFQAQVCLSEGDTFKPRVKSVGHTNSMTFSHMNISIK